MNVSGVIDHIVDWLETYRVQSKTNGFVVGVSGGIDSAVTAALCARTGAPTLLLEMPIHQAESQVARARVHMDNLAANFANVRIQKVELTSVFDGLIQELPQPNGESGLEMALVNTRARIRMTTLYYFAGLHGYLVAGTGNKVEDFGVGFFTKYGDGGVDLSPIADLMKTEVYAIGEAMNVPKAILVAPPTDGLWGDDRTDEDQIGASYPELEWAMNESTNGKTAGDFEGRQKEVFEIYTRLNRINQHKMNPIPVCLIPPHLKS